MPGKHREGQQVTMCQENTASRLQCCPRFPTMGQAEQPTSLNSTVHSEHPPNCQRCRVSLTALPKWSLKKKEGKWRESRCSESTGSRWWARLASTLARTDSTESVTSDTRGKALVSTVGQLVPFVSFPYFYPDSLSEAHSALICLMFLWCACVSINSRQPLP